MDASSTDLNLCFDTGHLLFGGGDVMATLDRWGDRIHHVHYKDIRPSIVEDVRKNNKSFLDAVIAGAFTVPGDGCIDFQAVSNSLAAMSYSAGLSLRLNKILQRRRLMITPKWDTIIF